MNNQIPFIYHYCDRWCERCGLKKNCAVFAQLDAIDEENLDDPDLWESMVKKLAKTTELSVPGALDEPEFCHISDEEFDKMKREMIRNDRVIKKTNLIKTAMSYAKYSGNILSDGGYWQSKALQMATDVKKGRVTEKESLHRVDSIEESMREIGWYFTFIVVKFSRAMMGRMSGEANRGLQSDANGSAKIALIAVERSINAFHELLKIFENESRLLKAVSQLKEIQRLGSLQFPNAMFFIRPGFDEQ